ncbi:Trans-hexaprenyltranstransferase [Candidatus Sulfotelmatobacter kueseliae]|uniref:Trans-hexaprenyltranstransferase n=1 Tax=Candidatus Sulfotelmatobacter kueseliae TaxID=2042962 RepID=A0A2U3KIH1_9BACT|nr:Trans-hexaprenyltranstransferase [Candidatus Sulfotelmatobacter kueseliae]
MSAPATINGKEIFDLLRDDLVALESEFGRDTVSDVQAITEIGEYLRAGGGKRIRPALLLLAAKLFDYRGSGAVRLGAVVEIIHTATLVHDDIIDDAKTRRGRPAANTQWGNSKCVLAGDWLYMQAFKIAVQERNFRILDTLIELTQQMVEGELLQMEKLGKPITLDEHFDLIFRKTACLFSVCLRLGAILGGATAEQEAALGQYGHDLGMAFQIVDDVLDLTASEAVLGKPVASDLREGKATMAVIHALDRCTPEERVKIEIILRDRAFNGVTHAQILEILERYGSLEAATARAVRYAESARKSICAFPDSEIKRALLWAPEFVVAREK